MTDIQKIRDVMNGFTGEIIEHATGKDELKRLFEEKKADDDPRFKGKDIPAGKKAVILGIISDGVNDALMTAQAAEKIARKLAAAQEYAAKAAGMIKTRTHCKAGELIWLDRPTTHDGKPNPYKWVGENPREAKALQGMQATMMAAQEYLNEYIRAIESAISNGRPGDKPPVFDTQYVDGFERAVVAGYKAAAEMLAKEHPADPTVAANIKRFSGELGDVATALSKRLGAQHGPAPVEFMKMRINVETMHRRDPDDWGTDIARYERVVALMAHAPVVAAPAVPKPGRGPKMVF